MSAAAARANTAPGSTAPRLPHAARPRAPRAARPAAAHVALMAYWGYVSGIHGSIAPLLARDFALSDGEIAGLFSWIGAASLAALAIGRAADRVGRRLAILTCAAGLPAAAVGSALAPGSASYLVAQLAAYGLGTALLALVTIGITEELPTGDRARGHGSAGLALAGGTALPLLATAVLADRPDAWRIVWAIAALPVLGLPWLARALPAPPRGSDLEPDLGPRPGLHALLAPEHRRAALAALGAVLAIQGAEAAARAWLFYHPVRGLGLAPRTATLLLVAGGALGMTGFRIGGWLADTHGRRPALLAGSAWLLVSLVALAAGGNAALASFRAHASELLPSPVRGTFGGLLAVGGSLGFCLSMSAVAALAAPVGGIGHAVACVVLVALPAAMLLLRRLPETCPALASIGAEAGAGTLRA